MWGRDKNFRVSMIFQLRNCENKSSLSQVFLPHPLFNLMIYPTLKGWMDRGHKLKTYFFLIDYFMFQGILTNFRVFIFLKKFINSVKKSTDFNMFLFDSSLSSVNPISIFTLLQIACVPTHYSKGYSAILRGQIYFFPSKVRALPLGVFSLLLSLIPIQKGLSQGSEILHGV